MKTKVTKKMYSLKFISVLISTSMVFLSVPPAQAYVRTPDRIVPIEEIQSSKDFDENEEEKRGEEGEESRELKVMREAFQNEDNPKIANSEEYFRVHNVKALNKVEQSERTELEDAVAWADLEKAFVAALDQTVLEYEVRVAEERLAAINEEKERAWQINLQETLLTPNKIGIEYQIKQRDERKEGVVLRSERVDALDADGDGIIDEQDKAELIEELKAAKKAAAQTEELVDLNSDGVIDELDIIEARRQEKQSQKEMEDRNGDGVITNADYDLERLKGEMKEEYESLVTVKKYSRKAVENRSFHSSMTRSAPETASYKAYYSPTMTMLDYEPPKVNAGGKGTKKFTRSVDAEDVLRIEEMIDELEQMLGQVMLDISQVDIVKETAKGSRKVIAEDIAQIAFQLKAVEMPSRNNDSGAKGLGQIDEFISTVVDNAVESGAEQGPVAVTGVQFRRDVAVQQQKALKNTFVSHFIKYVLRIAILEVDMTFDEFLKLILKLLDTTIEFMNGDYQPPVDPDKKESRNKFFQVKPNSENLTPTENVSNLPDTEKVESWIAYPDLYASKLYPVPDDANLIKVDARMLEALAGIAFPGVMDPLQSLNPLVRLMVMMELKRRFTHDRFLKILYVQEALKGMFETASKENSKNVVTLLYKPDENGVWQPVSPELIKKLGLRLPIWMSGIYALMIEPRVDADAGIPQIPVTEPVFPVS